MVANAVPPAAAAYHFRAVPVAVKLATVPAPQKVCVAVPMGAAGTAGAAFIVTCVDGETHPAAFLTKTVYVLAANPDLVLPT